MAPEAANQEEVVLAQEVSHVRVLTLNRPRQLNVISSRVVSLVAGFLEKWERDEDAKLVIIKVLGTSFRDDSCLEVVYRMYWLCNHIHSYKKTQVSLVQGIVMGGGAAFTVPSKFFSCHREDLISNTVSPSPPLTTHFQMFAVPEASIGFHTDCSFSYILSRLPGHLGKHISFMNAMTHQMGILSIHVGILGLNWARLSGNEMVSAGLATTLFHLRFKLNELEEHLLNLNTGDEDKVRTTIEEFKVDVQPDEDKTVEEIISSLGMKRSAPTGLKITLRSVREGRKQTLAECMKKEFRLTMNILRSPLIHAASPDLLILVFQGIRALTIDKDNAPRWISFFLPFKDELELNIPAEGDAWTGKYEDSVYPELQSKRRQVEAAP
ncbi:unnamed protein product [Spirodela intermedia]|uniref:3-hydroxyisobutyryl-CoA hydrolase n=1 Tax=Spirodela intermedia TaxID=51605 RepID=A0A7I8IWF7_SPIIN|nr:unnamed protein product [Spirodela intermedia]CAA6661339.1 unnamed protein product [Spirodela intermedia]